MGIAERGCSPEQNAAAVMPTVWAMRIPAGWGAMAPGSSGELRGRQLLLYRWQYSMAIPPYCGLVCKTKLYICPRRKEERHVILRAGLTRGNLNAASGSAKCPHARQLPSVI